MRVRMLRGTGYLHGQVLDPGEEYDLEERWALRFIAQGRAVAVTGPPAAAPEVVAHGDPVPTTRDPVTRRGRGTRG